MPDYSDDSVIKTSFNVFKNEIAFYKDIVPELRRFVNEEGIGDDLGR